MEKINIIVFIPSLLERSVGGKREVNVRASTVQGAIAQLLIDYPLLKPHLYEANGALREHVLIFYNSDNIRWLDSLDIPLRHGDTLTVLQAVSGG